MTGPFVQVQESRLHGPTWVNVARIVKIQQSSNVTTISLAGSSQIQIAEPAEALIGRIADIVAGTPTTSAPPARRANGRRPNKASPDGARPG